MIDVPSFEFFRLLPSAPAPVRADRSALGTIPTRAFRYCEAVTSASAFGWYVFTPLPLSLLYDGREVFASWEGVAGWFPLTSVQYPEFAATFDAVCPADISGYSPPFLGTLPEPGVVQLWTGLIVRSAPGWSTLVRPAANVPATKGFDTFEGVVETDRWFGPLFVNIRLLRTDCPIELTPDWPLAMCQPIPQTAYSDGTLNAPSVVDLGDLSEGDWADYRRTVVQPSKLGAPHPGRYAVETRRRRVNVG